MNWALLYIYICMYGIWDMKIYTCEMGRTHECPCLGPVCVNIYVYPCMHIYIYTYISWALLYIYICMYGIWDMNIYKCGICETPECLCFGKCLHIYLFTCIYIYSYIYKLAPVIYIYICIHSIWDVYENIHV